MQDGELINFADENTVVNFPNSVDDLFLELQKESEEVIEWLCSNEMLVNPNKFQSIIINSLLQFSDLKN